MTASTPSRYRRRQPVVEAIRFDGNNGDAVAAWCGGQVIEREGHPAVATMHTMPPAYVGWYVVRETLPDGSHRYYGMDGRVFEHCYEPAPPAA